MKWYVLPILGIFLHLTRPDGQAFVINLDQMVSFTPSFTKEGYTQIRTPFGFVEVKESADDLEKMIHDAQEKEK